MAPGIRTNWHAVSAIDNGSIVAVGGEKGELLFTGNSGGN